MRRWPPRRRRPFSRAPRSRGRRAAVRRGRRFRRPRRRLENDVVPLPPFHWWRTVFFLIPAIAAYTAVLGTLSLGSSLFEKTGHFAHWCARTWSRLILLTTGVRVRVEGLEKLEPGRTYV